MIKISFYKNGFTVEGHANFADSGKDIVCSAVSGIVLGSLNWFKKNEIIDFKQTQKPPYIKLVLKDNKNNQVALSLLLVQLSTIQQAYPDYLTIKENNLPIN